MLDFYHNHLLRVLPTTTLLYMDTESVIILLSGNNVEDKRLGLADDRLDNSGYDATHRPYSEKNIMKLGMFSERASHGQHPRFLLPQTKTVRATLIVTHYMFFKIVMERECPTPNFHLICLLMRWKHEKHVIIFALESGIFIEEIVMATVSGVWAEGRAVPSVLLLIFCTITMVLIYPLSFS